MNPAEFDQFIGLERSQPGQRNEFNEPESGFVRLFAAYAKREDLRDSEKVAAGAQMGALIARFTLRSTSKTRDLNADDRLVTAPVWGGDGVLEQGQVWNIKGIKRARGGRHQLIEITAVRSHAR